MSESDSHRQVADSYTEDEKVQPQENAEVQVPVAQDTHAQQKHKVTQSPAPEPYKEKAKKTFEEERAFSDEYLPAPDAIPALPSETRIVPQSFDQDAGDSNPSAGEQTSLNGLLSILALIREDVRSYRVLLFSNLILSFTIPLSALAVQDKGIFRLVTLWILPRPDWCLFSFWLLGVLSMAYGIYSIMPSINTRDEGLAVHRVNEAARYLAERRTHSAIGNLLKAIEKENERLETTNRSRKYFFLTFLLFFACVAIEFALILFS
jgi:hypothetical protein